MKLSKQPRLRGPMPAALGGPYRWVLIALGLAVVATIAGTYAARVYDARQREAAQKVLRSQTLGLSETIGRSWREVLAEVAAGVRVADASGALATADPLAAASRVEAALAELPQVDGARHVPASAGEVDESRFPPLGYAALDMVERARAGGTAPPVEALFFGTEQAHLALVQPVSKDAAATAGHMLVALSPSLVQSVLDRARGAMAPQGVFWEIWQIGVGKPLALASAGNASLREGLPHARQPIPGTTWQLASWSAATGHAGLGTQRAVWMAGALALAATALAGAWVWLRRRRGGQGLVYDGAAARLGGTAPGRGRAAPGRGRAAEGETPDGPTGSGSRGTAAPDPGRGLQPASEPAAGLGPPPPPDTAGIVVEEEVEGFPVSPEPQAPETPPPLPAASAVPPPAPAVEEPPLEASAALAASVFRAYDIRGRVGPDFDAGHVRELARAIGSEAYDRGQQTVIVARDGRKSSPDFGAAVIEGLLATGRDVIDIGVVPTPVLYFATYYLKTGSGVMVTGSHHPAEYNGLKVMLAGETLFEEEIVSLGARLARGDLRTGEGTRQEMDLLSEYIRRISEDIPVALGNAYRVVVDCGNGVAGTVAPKLFRALGHDVVELHCDLDGDFPNHLPDTSDPANLVDLQAAVREHEADIGFGFDGDGDRLAVVDAHGEIIWTDRLLMLYARDILSRNPGAKFIYDVKCTNRLGAVISRLGGVPVMWKTGHSFLKRKLREEGAQLAGEISGHIFFQERWYGFDDAMYAAARLLEILMSMKRPPTEILAKLPGGESTPELRLPVPEGAHLEFMEKFLATVEMEEAECSTIDGFRADFEDGWGLVRASNTAPALVFRFEGRDAASLERIQERFRAHLLRVDSDLSLPF